MTLYLGIVCLLLAIAIQLYTRESDENTTLRRERLGR